MGDPRVEDLLSLDRDVARAASALARWRTKLARAPEEHAAEDVIEPYRHVAGKSTWDALRALLPGAGETPLRDALVPWVGVLTVARVGREDDVAQARASAEAKARFAGDPPRLASWRQAWRGVVAAKTPAEARLWLEAAADVGPAVASAANEAAARRVEVARRLGLSNPWELLGAGEPRSLRAAAWQLLDATEDLALAVRKEALRAPVHAAEVIHLAVGREAGHGWPARLAPRWIEEVFGPGLSGLRIDLPPLPEALGAASFARALGALGFAVRIAAAPAGAPFSIAREPGSRAAHRLAAVFAGLAADAEWQARALGVGRRTALRQARVLARTALIDSRLAAARLLLGDDASPAPRDLFDELGPRLFGSALDARLRGAWPGVRLDEPARFLARIESRARGRALREGFDVDWYRNPRAWSHIRAASAVPAHEPVDDQVLSSEVDSLARGFEEALG